MRSLFCLLLLVGAFALNEPLEPRMAEVQEGTTIQVHHDVQGNLRAEIVDDLKSYDDVSFAKRLAEKHPSLEAQAAPCADECRADKSEYGVKADIVDSFPAAPGAEMRFRSLTMKPALILLEMTKAEITSEALENANAAVVTVSEVMQVPTVKSIEQIDQVKKSAQISAQQLAQNQADLLTQAAAQQAHAAHAGEQAIDARGQLTKVDVQLKEDQVTLENGRQALAAARETLSTLRNQISACELNRKNQLSTVDKKAKTVMMVRAELHKKEFELHEQSSKLTSLTDVAENKLKHLQLSKQTLDQTINEANAAIEKESKAVLDRQVAAKKALDQQLKELRAGTDKQKKERQAARDKDIALDLETFKRQMKTIEEEETTVRTKAETDKNKRKLDTASLIAKLAENKKREASNLEKRVKNARSKQEADLIRKSGEKTLKQFDAERKKEEKRLKVVLAEIDKQIKRLVESFKVRKDQLARDNGQRRVLATTACAEDESKFESRFNSRAKRANAEYDRIYRREQRELEDFKGKWQKMTQTRTQKWETATAASTKANNDVATQTIIVNDLKQKKAALDAALQRAIAEKQQAIMDYQKIAADCLRLRLQLPDKMAAVKKYESEEVTYSSRVKAGKALLAQLRGEIALHTADANQADIKAKTAEQSAMSYARQIAGKVAEVQDMTKLASVAQQLQNVAAAPPAAAPATAPAAPGAATATATATAAAGPAAAKAQATAAAAAAKDPFAKFQAGMQGQKDPSKVDPSPETILKPRRRGLKRAMVGKQASPRM